MALLEIHHHLPVAPAPAGPDLEAAALLREGIARFQEQTRHADTKANLLLVVAGVAAAAATSVLPRLAGTAAVLGWTAVAPLLVALVVLGAAVWPGRGRARPRSATAIARRAARAASAPAVAVAGLATEQARLERIVHRKWALLRAALVLFAAAASLAVASGLTAWL